MVYKLYLASKLDGVHYNTVIEWYDLVRTLLGCGRFELLCPLRGREYLKDQIIDNSMLLKDNCYYPFTDFRTMVERDKTDIRRCDALLANLSLSCLPALGTACEMTLAKELRKPVIAIISDKSPQNPNMHPFILAASDYIVDNTEQACNIILALFNYEFDNDCFMPK